LSVTSYDKKQRKIPWSERVRHDLQFSAQLAAELAAQLAAKLTVGDECIRLFVVTMNPLPIH
jgi:hypothetical protein